MRPQCNSKPLEFEGQGRRRLVAKKFIFPLARISHQGVALFSRVQLGAGFSASGRARDRRA